MCRRLLYLLQHLGHAELFWYLILPYAPRVTNSARHISSFLRTRLPQIFNCKPDIVDWNSSVLFHYAWLAILGPAIRSRLSSTINVDREHRINLRCLSNKSFYALLACSTFARYYDGSRHWLSFYSHDRPDCLILWKETGTRYGNCLNWEHSRFVLLLLIEAPMTHLE